MSTTPADSLPLSVLSRYPLSKPRVAGPLEASKRNDNFLVEDVVGSRFVLRRYRRNTEKRRVDFQIRFQEHLRGHGFPTSEVIRTRSGGSVVMRDQSPWALFTYIKGSQFDFGRMGQVVEAARRLAQFQTVAESFQHEEVIIDTNPMVRRWWVDGENDLHKLQEMFASLGVDEELTFVRNWLAALLQEWPLNRLDALPTCWVHGDYHGRNMAFVEDELRGLFDFDVVHRGLRIEDVAHGLFMFGREFRGSHRIRPEVAKLFLGEYARNRPLQKEEREALPMMIVLNWAPSAPYYSLLQRDGEETTLFLRNHISIMRDLQFEIALLGPIIMQ